MNVTPVNKATNTVTTAPSPSQQSARERAIARLTSGQAEQPIVQNQNAIKPEEMTAILPKKEAEQALEKTEEKLADSGQSNTSVEAPKEEKAPEPQLSSQLAQLARKEKALRQQQQEIKAQQAALQAREDAIAAAKAAVAGPDLSKYVSVDELTKSPWDVLNKHGLTYDQLTAQALNQPSAEQQALNQELSSLKAEIKALKDGQDAVKTSYEENQKQAYSQAVAQIRNEAENLIKDNPAYEAIAYRKSVPDVVKLIERTFHEDGILLTVEEAANEIENHLLEEAMSLSKLNKVQQRLKAAAPSQAAPAKQDAGTQTKQQAKPTLTNSMTATRPLTAKERAILAFKGELKKS